jgi:transcriptional regulator with XRE-family HTH domain
MDAVRFGLSMRALRRRRRWRQADLAEQAGVSRTAISRVERGRADRLTVRAQRAVAGALGARFECRLLWNGEALDRLLDESHAALVDIVIRWLRAAGWTTAPEVSFSVRGERGSIDVLAFHPTAVPLLVVEVKSVVPDLQAMLVTVDRKTRLASEIARERGWRPARAGGSWCCGRTGLRGGGSRPTKRRSRAPSRHADGRFGDGFEIPESVPTRPLLPAGRPLRTHRRAGATWQRSPG